MGSQDESTRFEAGHSINAAPLATALGIGMLTVRKGGKLPGPVIGVDYALEYGTARMELRPDSVHEGDRVLVIDDVMATGGTAKASIQLLEQAGARVEAICVLLELEGLGGRNVIDQSIFEPIVVIED